MLSGLEEEVRATAARLAGAVLEPRADALDREGGFPRASLLALAEAGLLGVTIPQGLGGLGSTTVAYAAAVEELARVCASTTVALCVSNMVAEVVTMFGSAQQRERWVPQLCDGSLGAGAFGLSEPGAGSDPSSMTTRAEPTSSGWVLHGSKMWITSGTHAGLFVVWARTDAGAGARGLSCFLVPGDAPGLVRGSPEDKLGLHGSTTTPLHLEGVEVDGGALLGSRGDGFRIAMMALDGGRVGIAAQALGIAVAALEDTIDHLAARGETPTKHVQAMADSAVEIEAGRALVERAARLKSQGKTMTVEASMAKLYCSEAANRICERMIAVVGLPALHGEGRWSRYLRDARVTTIYEGTSEIQRLVLSRALAKPTA